MKAVFGKKEMSTLYNCNYCNVYSQGGIYGGLLMGQVVNYFDSDYWETDKDLSNWLNATYREKSSRRLLNKINKKLKRSFIVH